MSGIDGARELRDITAAEPVGVNSKSSPLAERVPRRVERTSDGTQPARSPAPKWHQSLRRLGAALVVAIAASAFGAPALAQTHCDATDANELWCASLTVGTGTLSGNTYYGAYQLGLNDFGGYGTTSRVFSYRTARIKVDILVHDTANLHVIINNDSGTTPADGLLGASSFSLEIGTGGTKKSFPIVNPGTASSFSYPKQGLSWSTGSTVPVKLVRASGGPLVSTAIPDQHAVAGTAFRYAFPSDTFNDIDGDALTYTATKPDGTDLPTWLRFAASTRTFSGTAGATDVGTVAVKVTASDGSESISDEFNIVVRAAGLAHCNASDPLEVWCATMTAGGEPFGYDSRAGLGSLSPNQFPYKGTPYTVIVLTIFGGALNLRLQPSGETVFGNNARFALRIGTTTFSFDDTTIAAVIDGNFIRFGKTVRTWSIGDVIPFKLLRVVPKAANKTVKTGADADYAFTAADFNLLDTGYAPKVVTLPGRGTLKLNGVPVGAGESVSHARIDAGDLTYTPPQGEVGKDMSDFTFKVNDGELDSARSYTITIDVASKLAGNLDQTAASAALSLPATGASAYAQRLRTGSSAQEIEEVRLAITAPSGVTPKVSIWYGETKPERELEGLELPNPSNIHTAADAVKRFKANSRTTGGYSLATDSEDYWIVVERAADTGTISLKQTTGGNDALAASGWALTGNHWKKDTSNNWSRGTTGALQAELRTVAWRQPLTRVLNMELSGPGPDELYTHGENLDIAVTFSEVVNIPDAKITAPLVCAGDANDVSGNRTNRVVFRCEIKGGPHTRVEVRANTLRPGDSDEGPPVSDAHPAVERMTAVHGVTGPGITGVRVNSPGPDGLWTPGERVEVRYTFDAPMTVTTRSGTPVAWVQRVYTSGKIYGEAVPFDRIDTNDANTLVFAKTLGGNEQATALEIPANSLYPKHGVIVGTDTGAIAVFTHSAYNTQVEVEPPTVTSPPAVSPAGPDNRWSEGETVEVTIAFREAVEVDTSDGTPSIGIGLGGSQARSAGYLRGSGTAELVFAYTLVTGDGTHTAMGVTPDSLALNGGAIRSVATSVDAVLGHNGTIVQGTARRTTEAPTARFADVPANHDGTAFTVELHFSAAPDGLTEATVAGGLLEATGATVVGARQLTAGSDLAWEVTVRPDSGGDIGLRLPARPCGKPNAICVGGRPLAQAATGTIRGAPLTASFSNVPTEHDGSGSFELRFHLSEEPAGLSYRTVHNGLFDVSGGSIGRAGRLQKDNNTGWGLRVEPAGFGDVTLVVRETTDCAGTPGVCTSDGRMLGGGLSVTVRGPVALAVADAEVDEAEGATLDFTVSVSRSSDAEATVDYATSDGTATAGSDYTATSGTLTFAAGEMSKTVTVTVHDDSYNENPETVVLTLSNPSGAVLGDASAIGTINNTDPMPKAWMVRFGRTVGSQVVDALTQRLDGAGASHVTVAGIDLAGGSGVEPVADEDDPFGLPEWAKNAGREADARTITADDLLLRSAFHLSSGGEGTGGGPAFTAWGRVATGGFETEEDSVTMDGDVTTGLIGLDAEWERALAGMMLSQSNGKGSYQLDAAKGDDAGTVESSLTGVYLYARVNLNRQVSAWALAGMGSGELTLHQEDGESMPTDISMRMGAVGVKGQVLDGSGPSGLGLNVKSDAMWVGTKSEDTDELAPTEGDVTRLRLILQGERVFEAGNGATFTPSAEIGLRHDGGDAETGTGVEVGAGVRYIAGPITIEGQVRTLIAHEASGYEEWGMSGAIRVTPSASGRGLTLSIAPAWGQTGSAAERLWSAHDARAFGADSEFEADSRLAIDAGYGFGLPGNRGVLTPYAGLTLGDSGNRTVRAGTRWQWGPDTVVGVEAIRQASDADEADNQLMLRAALRF